ncbi:sensor histidine kinase, partial [Pontibacter sp. HJ8]
LGELTAGIAHEIQNPLNFVNNFAEVNNDLIAELKGELAAGHLPEATTLAEFIQGNEKKISLHGKRADAIVKGMLQHARTSSGERQPTDLNTLTNEYLNLAYAGLRAQNPGFTAKMITAFDPRLGKVEVAPQDISRVLLNLFNNAFYAVQQKQHDGAWYEPKVRVSTGRQDGRAFIKVWDNGTGIPIKVRDKIFQPFFTTKPAGQGTGLGLSLSYDIITKEHGGQVTVASEEGEWTEFTVLLPYTPVAAKTPPVSEDAPPASTLS